MSDKWYLQKGMRTPKPGEPRREVAQEFFTNVLELGEHARQRYLDECKVGLQHFDQKELDAFDENLAIVRAELSKFQ